MLAVWAKTHKERTARTILDLSSCRPVVANINYVLNKKKERMCEQRKEGRIERVMNGRPTSAASNLVCTHTHTHTHTHTEDSSWQLLDGILICPRSPDRPARTCQNIERKRAWERGERQRGRAGRERRGERELKGKKGEFWPTVSPPLIFPRWTNRADFYQSRVHVATLSCWLFSNMCTVRGLFWFIQSSSCYGLSYWEEEGMVVESQVRPSQWPPLILTHRSICVSTFFKCETKGYF